MATIFLTIGRVVITSAASWGDAMERAGINASNALYGAGMRFGL